MRKESIIDILEKYERIHVLLTPKNLSEAASFLVGSLLLGHNVRRDTIAIVYLRRAIIAVPGDRVRQLRPDHETATGWIRAVLRGKHRGLGALLLEEPPELNNKNTIIIKYSAPKSTNHLCKGANYWTPKTIIKYTSNTETQYTLKTWLPPGYAAAVVNIALDRLKAKLNPCL